MTTLNDDGATEQLKLSYMTGITLENSVLQLTLLLPSDPTVPLLGICRRGMKTNVRTETHTQMFVAGLFLISNRSESEVFHQVKEEQTSTLYNEIVLGPQEGMSH